MSNWTKIKTWVGDTINFTYIKSLIAGESNKDLRELVATVLASISGISFLYAMHSAKTDEAKLYLLITLFSFISALYGMSKFGNKKPDEPTTP